MPNVNIETPDWLCQTENILEEPEAGAVIANDEPHERYLRKTLRGAGNQGSGFSHMTRNGTCCTRTMTDLRSPAALSNIVRQLALIEHHQHKHQWKVDD
jgi:hypothetical protein